jgi:hypothetical protein
MSTYAGGMFISFYTYIYTIFVQSSLSYICTACALGKPIFLHFYFKYRQSWLQSAPVGLRWLQTFNPKSMALKTDYRHTNEVKNFSLHRSNSVLKIVNSVPSTALCPLCGPLSSLQHSASSAASALSTSYYSKPPWSFILL